MIYDELGLPRPEGASDFLDSSCVAGLMVLFDYKCVGINLELYRKQIIPNNIPFPIGTKGTIYVRHPKAPEKPDFSRDQTICLWAGYWEQRNIYFVDKCFVTGNDFFSPANIGHMKRCQGKKASWFQNLWLKLEILYHAKFTPLEESNQLIAMMMVAGNDYLKLWTKHNSQWRESLRVYWYQGAGAWRNEKDFCEHMIKVIEEKIK